jgi:hypothetical protein
MIVHPALSRCNTWLASRRYGGRQPALVVGAKIRILFSLSQPPARHRLTDRRTVRVAIVEAVGAALDAFQDRDGREVQSLRRAGA